jgi:hypothetical protein
MGDGRRDTSQLFSYQYAAKFSRAYENLRAGSTCWFPSPREASVPSTRADDAGGLARGGVGELTRRVARRPTGAGAIAASASPTTSR